MVLCFVHYSEEIVCRNGKFAGYPAKQFGLDNYQSRKIVIEVEDEVYIPTLLATLADYMSEWNDHKKVTNSRELVDYLDKLITHYICEIDYYYQRDDWDDYFVLLLQAHKILSNKSEWFVDCNLHHYNCPVD